MKAMDIKDFTYLFLATVANKSQVINLYDRKVKAASLPSTYKESIEKIMLQNNGWDKEFSILIDTEEYFEDHYKWEEKFSRCLRDVLKELKKEVKYNLVFDQIYIEFTKEEINEILSRYPDKEINSAMDHFANLVKDIRFTRQYKALMKDLDLTKNKNRRK